MDEKELKEFGKAKYYQGFWKGVLVGVVVAGIFYIVAFLFYGW